MKGVKLRGTLYMMCSVSADDAP